MAETGESVSDFGLMQESQEYSENQPILGLGDNQSSGKPWTSSLSEQSKKDKGPPTFRKKLGITLEGHRVQLILSALTILDLIVVGVELFLEEHYGRCGDKPIPHAVHTAEQALMISSTVILCILGFEVLLVLFAFGLKFFKHPFYVVDLVVIAASLIFELVLKQFLANLLIIFRLWRIVRIAHGVAVSLEERAREKLKLVEAHNKKLRNIIGDWRKKYNIMEPPIVDVGGKKPV